MKRIGKNAIIFLAVILFPACFFNYAFAGPPPVLPESPIKSAAAILYDLDNDVILFEQNADMQIPPASTTKILSMFLALDKIKKGEASLDSLVEISPKAASTGGSVMGLHAREKVELNKLLMGMAVSSGNDASYAVAEHIGGSHDNFIKMMNARARELGMTSSHFYNPHGLPHPGHVTTARDMLKLATAYLKAHPDSLKYHNTKLLEHRGYRSWNKNPLLDQYPGADGLKSGWIRDSGYNLVFTAQKDGRRLLAVILGAPDSTSRAVEAWRLLDAGFMIQVNEVPTVTAALDLISPASIKIDPVKTGRDAGLLKKQLSRRLLAGKYGQYARNAFKRNQIAPGLLRKPAHLRQGAPAVSGKKAAAKRASGQAAKLKTNSAAKKSAKAAKTQKNQKTAQKKNSQTAHRHKKNSRKNS